MQQRLCFQRFEDLVEKSVACMHHLFAWLGLPEFGINFERMMIGIRGATVTIT